VRVAAIQKNEEKKISACFPRSQCDGVIVKTRSHKPSPKVDPNDGGAWARFSISSQPKQTPVTFHHSFSPSQREILCGVPDRLPSVGCLRIFSNPDTGPTTRVSVTGSMTAKMFCGLADSPDTPCRANRNRTAAFLSRLSKCSAI